MGMNQIEKWVQAEQATNYALGQIDEVIGLKNQYGLSPCVEAELEGRLQQANKLLSVSKRERLAAETQARAWLRSVLDDNKAKGRQIGLLNKALDEKEAELEKLRQEVKGAGGKAGQEATNGGTTEFKKKVAELVEVSRELGYRSGRLGMAMQTLAELRELDTLSWVAMAAAHCDMIHHAQITADVAQEDVDRLQRERQNAQNAVSNILDGQIPTPDYVALREENTKLRETLAGAQLELLRKDSEALRFQQELAAERAQHHTTLRELKQRDGENQQPSRRRDTAKGRGRKQTRK